MNVNKIWAESFENIGELKHLQFYHVDFFSKFFNEIDYNLKEFNSLGFRSDEFKTNHKDFHILFTGCSTTIGISIEEKYIWTKLVYEKIKKEKKCSGYFNLAIGGTSFFDQVFNLFKYFKKYGNPDCIFFCMPDALRFYYDDNSKIRHAVYDEKEHNLLLFLGYQYYLMLETYCKNNNILLYSFTWAGNHYKKSFNDCFSKEFKSFYSINIKERDDFMFNYIEKNKNLKNLEKAKDNIHQGIAYHEYFADFIYKKYKENE